MYLAATAKLAGYEIQFCMLTSHSKVALQKNAKDTASGLKLMKLMFYLFHLTALALSV